MKRFLQVLFSSCRHSAVINKWEASVKCKMEKNTEEIESIEKSDIRNVPKNILKEFLEAYRANPALWKIKNKEVYGNRNLKLIGYKELLKIWKKHDSQADIRTVKLKIQSLRGSFRKELKKLEISQRSGSGVDDIYKPQLWYFSLMSFLRDHELPTESSDNIEDEVTPNKNRDTFDESFTEMEGEINENECSGNSKKGMRDTTTSGKRMKISEEQERRNFIAKCTEAMSAKPDDNEAFAQYMATKLRKVENVQQKMLAEVLLTKVLNNAIMNKLTECTDISESSRSSFSSNYSCASVPSPQEMQTTASESVGQELSTMHTFYASYSDEL